ncbi:MAG TPA: hypothetical protein QGG47_11550 [Acidobacteriota bacterium]|nr:hypothetical protein [Acidobacteriota bacterium]
MTDTPIRKPPTIDETDALIGRLKRNSINALVVLAVVVGATTWSLAQVAGLLLSGILMLLNLHGLVATADGILSTDQQTPGALQGVLLLGRYVLLGMGLCAIVLLPGVGPIPVALGLSILVIAILLEAIFNLSAGADRRS